MKEKSQTVKFGRDLFINHFVLNTYEEGEKIFDEYKRIANDLKITINLKKSHIIKLNRPFQYCKWRYRLLENGKVICIPSIKTIRRQRIRLSHIYR